jgi:transcriptional regulator with XRE-family HTH domain
MSSPAAIGPLLRDWRQRRRLSQLDLACEAEISTRHLSFVETGRARPSREMLMHLLELLDIPLRERNTLLLAAGFAPAYAEHDLQSPMLAAAHEAVQMVLRGHEPYPALAIDRHWNLLAANQAATRLMAGVAAELLQPPINVLRVNLHPQGLAPRIVNLRDVREHILSRLRRTAAQSGDRALRALHDELAAYPCDDDGTHAASASPHLDVVLPVRFRSEAGELALFTTITQFGTPLDVTLSELALESFYPADAATAALLRRLAEL